MFSYIKSYFRPVIKEKDNNIKLFLRGIVFEAESREELCRQLQLTRDSICKKLKAEMGTTMYMHPSSNVRGKWNTGAVMMNNTRKTLEAIDDYLENYCW